MKLSEYQRSAILSKKLLIFDFDGTIVDSSPIHAEAFKVALSTYNFEINYENLKGLSTHESMKKIFKENNFSTSKDCLEQLISSKQKIAQDLFEKNLILMEGFDKCLKFILNKKLCIASSASKASIMNGLKKNSLEEIFDLILSNDDVNLAKPNPEIFLKALDFFRVDSEDALIFEDSNAGFEAANRANIDFIDINDCSWLVLADIFMEQL